VDFVPDQWRSILRRFSTTPAPQTAAAAAAAAAAGPSDLR